MMHPPVGHGDMRARYLLLSAMLLVLAGVSIELDRVGFDVLAAGLVLCAAILLRLALRRPRRGRR